MRVDTIAKTMGMTGQAVTRWIRKGYLKAEAGRGGKTGGWSVDPASVAAFAKSRSEELADQKARAEALAGIMDGLGDDRGEPIVVSPLKRTSTSESYYVVYRGKVVFYRENDGAGFLRIPERQRTTHLIADFLKQNPSEIIFVTSALALLDDVSP